MTYRRDDVQKIYPSGTVNLILHFCFTLIHKAHVEVVRTRLFFYVVRLRQLFVQVLPRVWKKYPLSLHCRRLLDMWLFLQTWLIGQCRNDFLIENDAVQVNFFVQEFIVVVQQDRRMVDG